MLGKVFVNAKGFGQTCRYLEREESLSKVLAVEGVRGHHPRLMAEDFERQHQLMPQKKSPVFHAALTFPHGERLTDERLVELSKEYLRRIGMINTQYALVKHTDKEHLHVHVLANRVDNDGKPTGQGLIIERSMKAAAELTREYGLREDQGKRLEQTNLAALHEPDAKRYHIYMAIRQVLPECRDLNDLEARLGKQQISVRYRLDPETNERRGVSFRYDNRSFKGSGVDADFSLKGLERTLDLQERQVQEKQQMQALERELEGLVGGRLVGWDEAESARRRQDLKLRLERAEEARSPKQERRLKPGTDEGLDAGRRLDDERQEQRQVQRRGLRL